MSKRKEHLEIYLTKIDGKEFIEIRVFSSPSGYGKDNDWKPTNRGVRLKVEQLEKLKGE